MHLFILDDNPVLVWDRQGFVAAYLINAAPCMALLTSLSLHAARTRTWRNGKALAYEPGFEDAAYNMECACLYDASADTL